MKTKTMYFIVDKYCEEAAPFWTDQPVNKEYYTTLKRAVFWLPEGFKYLKDGYFEGAGHLWELHTDEKRPYLLDIENNDIKFLALKQVRNGNKRVIQ